MNIARFVSITDADLARPAGFVYVIYAPRHRAIYVGQTRGVGGALGRLSQHLSDTENATFRSRIAALFGFESVEIGPVEFMACNLGSRSEVAGDNRAYREAVEAGTQVRLLQLIAASQVRPGVVVSRVQHNGYQTLPWVVALSEECAQSAHEWLGRICGTADG